MKTVTLAPALILLAVAGLVPGQTPKRRAEEQPQPRVVEPGDAARPPSDAVVLFNGRDLTGWTRPDGRPSGCTAEEGGIMACTSGAGDAVTREKFQSIQLHLEFNSPALRF